MSTSKQTITEVSSFDEAEIRIDTQRQIAPVDTNIYAGFLEHMGRCIYGGVIDEPHKDNEAYVNSKGYRLDVAQAIKDLEMPTVRWPGGNFVSSYHWLDGVGPVDQRPRRPELAWLGEEPNTFGTDEFIEWCRYMNVEPYICLNMGTGTLDEALAWIEYCNSDKNTYYANLRRKNGHEKPYNVKYWSLGNEVWGDWQVGQMTKEDYSKKAFQWAKAIKLLDPSVILISCGNCGYVEWDRYVVHELANSVEMHSIHMYTSSAVAERNAFTPACAEIAIQLTQSNFDFSKINKKQASNSTDGSIYDKAPLKICFDEWNVWDPVRAPGVTGAEEKYTLSDAVAVGSWLNVFIRQAASLGMCNIAQLVNVIAPIMTSKEGIFLQTIYHPLRLFSNYMKNGNSLNLHVKSPLYKGPTGYDNFEGYLDWAPKIDSKLPYLDCSSVVRDDEDAVYLAVTNRSETNDITSKISFADDGPKIKSIKKWEVYHDDVNITNNFEQPNNVVPLESDVPAEEGFKFTLTFKKHSVTIVKFSY